MPKKNAKKNVRKIKQTRKQKKKSELKKKVRKVIRQKYEDSSSDEVLYQAERDYYSSSSDSTPPKKRNAKRRYKSTESSSSSESRSDSQSRSKSRSDSQSRSKSRSDTQSRSKSRSDTQSRSKSRSESRRQSDSSSKSRSNCESMPKSKKKSKRKLDSEKEYSGSKVAPEESMIKDKEMIKKYMDDLAFPTKISRIKDDDLVPFDAPPKEENARQQERPASPLSSEVRPHTPPRDDRPHTPPREDRPHTPPRDDRPHTPQREDRPHTPPREDRPHTPPRDDRPHAPPRDDRPHAPPREDRPHTPPRDDRPHTPPRDDRPHTPPRDEAPSKDDKKDFDESMLQSKFQYVYDTEYDVEPTEFFSSKKVEEFILGKGFMILEYFVVHGLCAFILIQLPSICETMMVYVNRKKFPIQVGESSYKKTTLEKLKIEKCEDDTYDYENMTLTGFDLSHTLDTIKETNQQQKSLSYYVYRQISRMMYVTKNIEIKPCILLHNIFGFYETYHIPDRKSSKEFYPVISLETLFSKTFLLEQNIPVFYQRFYSIMNQSNRNKMEYLETSLKGILKKMDLLRQEVKELQTKDNDKLRVKTIVDRLDKQVEEISKEKREILETVTDRVAQSYQIKRLDDHHSQIELKKAECNALYSEIKREYDKHVFHHELVFHELYYKIRDTESLDRYLE